MINKKLIKIIGASALGLAVVGGIIGVTVFHNTQENKDKDTETCVTMTQEEDDENTEENVVSVFGEESEQPTEENEGEEQLGNTYKTLEEAWDAGLACIRDEKGDLVFNPNSESNRITEAPASVAVAPDNVVPPTEGTNQNTDNNPKEEPKREEPTPTPQPEPQPAPAPVEVPKEEKPKDKIDIVVSPDTEHTNLDKDANAGKACPYAFGEYATRVYYNGEGQKASVYGYYVGSATGNPKNPSCAYFNNVYPNGKYGDETMSIFVGEYSCGYVWFMMFV